MLIYKIMTKAQWARFDRNALFVGAPVDLEDGYIHFSTAGQVRETAARHFAGQHDLRLVWAEADSFGDALKWEKSRGGDSFPHLYGRWAMSDVAGHTDLPLIGDEHQFPVEME